MKTKTTRARQAECILFALIEKTTVKPNTCRPNSFVTAPSMNIQARITQFEAFKKTIVECFAAGATKTGCATFVEAAQ